MTPTPGLLPGKSRGWRSLLGYSPWGRKESDMTEATLACSHALSEKVMAPHSIGFSCLENPMDGGAW